MNKKIRVLIIILIILIFCFIGGLSYYKFVISKKQNENNNKETSNMLEMGPVQEFKYETNYFEKYGEKIINDNINTSIDFFVIEKDNAIYGKLELSSNGKLYIFDNTNKVNKVLLNENKINYIYSCTNSGQSGLFAYMISENGKGYYITLVNADINKIIIKELSIPGTITNFVNIKLPSYMQISDYNSIIVYTKEGKMYDAYSGVEYNEKLLNVFNQYIVYADKSVSNIEGKMLINSKGEKYKVKYIIATLQSDKSVFEYNPNIIIITETNKLIYLTLEDRIYVYPKNVKDIKHNNNKITIVFENNEKIEFEGTYDENYFPIR